MLNTVCLPLSAVHPPPPYRRRAFAAQCQRSRAAKREARRQEREARRQQWRRQDVCTSEELADSLAGLDQAATHTTQVSIRQQITGG